MARKNVLSLFSGCGGMDLGFEGDFSVPCDYINNQMHPSWICRQRSAKCCRLPSTSFQTVFANDIRQGARTAWTNYFGNVRGVKDAQSVFRLGSIVDIVKEADRGMNAFSGKDIDVVTGGFPCQDFSIAGNRNGFKSNKNHNGDAVRSNKEANTENRGLLYFWMKRVIEIVQPKVFVAENVKGLVSLSNAKDVIESDFRECGYLVVPARVLKSYEYGIPQNRERVFFMGFRKDLLSEVALNALNQTRIPGEYDPYPLQTHYLPAKNDESENTFRKSLLPSPKLRVAFRGLHEPEDSDDMSQRTFSKAKWYGSHCQGQTEVNIESISPTIRAEHHGNIEFRRLSPEHGGRYFDEINQGYSERRLTVRECARVQTFPDDYRFVSMEKGEGSLSGSEAYKLIGNAVPPFLAYHIATRLDSIWNRLFGVLP